MSLIKYKFFYIHRKNFYNFEKKEQRISHQDFKNILNVSDLKKPIKKSPNKGVLSSLLKIQSFFRTYKLNQEFTQPPLLTLEKSGEYCEKDNVSKTSLLSFLKTDNYKSFEKAPDRDHYNQTKSNDLELIKKLRTKLVIIFINTIYIIIFR